MADKNNHSESIKPSHKQVGNRSEIAIIANIRKLLNAGYELRLSKLSMEVIEPYKSEVRDKWYESKVVSSMGLNYWTDGTLYITAKSLQEWVNDLVAKDKEAK